MTRAEEQLKHLMWYCDNTKSKGRDFQLAGTIWNFSGTRVSLEINFSLKSSYESSPERF